MFKQHKKNLQDPGEAAAPGEKYILDYTNQVQEEFISILNYFKVKLNNTRFVAFSCTQEVQSAASARKSLCAIFILYK